MLLWKLQKYLEIIVEELDLLVNTRKYTHKPQMLAAASKACLAQRSSSHSFLKVSGIFASLSPVA